MEDNQGTVQSAMMPAQQEVQPNLFTQDQVNKLIGREKMQAKEAGRREAEERYQREMEAAGRAQQEQRNAEVPRDVDANAIYQQVQERFNRDQERLKQEMHEQQVKQHVTKVANTYQEKFSLGKDAYEDFEDVTKDFDPTAFPQLTFLLAGMDNMADVLYDLSKNPLKLAGIDRLAERNPRQAQSELLKLSQSIGANKQAQAEAQNQNVAEPLDRLKSSRVSGSNGKMSIADLRNQPWLRR